MQKGVSDTLPTSPFTRLRGLLDDVAPPQSGPAPVSLALGEPQHAPPSFALSAVSENIEQYRRYPPIAGTPDWQNAARGWLERRFGVTDALSQAAQVLPLNGTREGLFLAAQIAPPKTDGLMVMPDPFYQIYASATYAAGAQPHYLAATAQNGFLPDLEALTADVLARCRALYLCNPANPQGVVADKAYLTKALNLAQEHGFLLLVDECYAEIYDPQQTPPPSILEVMQETGQNNAPIIAFHSLSKRSNLPGLRSGIAAGGADAMQAFVDLRQIAGPQCPMPAQAAAALAWGDDAHVEDNRARYAEKFDFADSILTGHFSYQRPAAGFFLWLNVGDGEAAALHLWREEGIKVLPGGYLAAPATASNSDLSHAAPYIRVALVADLDVTKDALPRLKTALDAFMAQAKGGGA